VVKRRVVLVVAGLCLALAFAALGRWQLGREAWKREWLAQSEAALAAPARDLATAIAEADAAPWPVRVHGEGRFLAKPVLWLDNQRRGERVGVRKYCAFQPARGPALLVDLGWLPLAADRRLPAEACPDATAALAGLLAPPPAPGLALGPGLQAQADGSWLALRLVPAEVAAAWELPALAGQVLRLDPALPLGHERDLAPLANTLPPERHRGYAIQWFGLSAATLVILIVMNLRRRR
jgi:cytochrome oxidase assembly protein ShyY1